MPGTGAWAAYNDAVAAATALATSWRVDVSLSSATATGLADGALVGEVLLLRDDAGDDPFGNEFGWVAGSSAGSGSACLEATLAFRARAFVAGDVHDRDRRLTVGPGVEVTLALTIAGVLGGAQLHDRRRRVDARRGDPRR